MDWAMILGILQIVWQILSLILSLLGSLGGLGIF